MLQLNPRYLELDSEGNFVNKSVIANLYNLALPILNHRKYLYERYKRTEGQEIIAPFERYITNIAAGYAFGKSPRFTVNCTHSDSTRKAIKQLFGKEYPTEQDTESYKLMVDYINDYNDLPLFNYQLGKDYIITGSAYAREYQNEDGEIVYAPLSSLQTIAIYDYQTPPEKIALLRIWQERNAELNIVNVVELTTMAYRKVFVNCKEEWLERAEDHEDLHWLLCPFMAMENPEGQGLFEPVLTLIDAYEKVLENTKHTFEYNDNNGCKLMIVGYAPLNPLMVENESGEMVKNPLREEEDKLVLEAPTFYTDENGKVEWITKNINDTAMENHKNTLVSNILKFAAIPDADFTSSNITATAVERSFFPLEQYVIEADRIFKKEYLSLWENITSRINLKKHTTYDFRDIQIDFMRNLPTDKATMVSNAVLLQPLLSRETLLRQLPYEIDIEEELQREPSSDKVINEVQTSAIGSSQRANQYDGSQVKTVELKQMEKQATENATKESV